jgi:hypothetical protein
VSSPAAPPVGGTAGPRRLVRSTGLRLGNRPAGRVGNSRGRNRALLGDMCVGNLGIPIRAALPWLASHPARWRSPQARGGTAPQARSGAARRAASRAGRGRCG